MRSDEEEDVALMTLQRKHARCNFLLPDCCQRHGGDMTADAGTGTGGRDGGGPALSVGRGRERGRERERGGGERGKERERASEQ